tara:strand:+ start:1319 stop:1717 length:399 start_codon:yes stop_codon:yes gene_type:complete
MNRKLRKSRSKSRVKSRVRKTRSKSRVRSRVKSRVRSRVKSRVRRRSNIRSIFKKGLKKQKGGQACKTSNNTFSGKGNSPLTNTRDNINNLGGEFFVDTGSEIATSTHNIYNNLVGNPEIMSPSITEQPIGN